MKLLRAILKAGICFVCLKVQFSYLDPGSGSLIVQLLIAIVVGILATFRFWKSRFLSLLGIKEESDQEDDDELGNED